jgi:hypothetical protein
MSPDATPHLKEEVPVLALRCHSRFLLLVLVILLALAAPASATTLVRQGLEALTADNEAVVHARVLEVHSYWNADRSLIFTDVRAKPLQALKGDPREELVVTLLGGTVGETTLLIIGAPELRPGAEYVLFLTHAEAAGDKAGWRVRDLAQGVFDVVNGRAYSQADRELLLPDDSGESEAPGGAEGFLLESLVQQVRDIRQDGRMR